MMLSDLKRKVRILRQNGWDRAEAGYEKFFHYELEDDDQVYLIRRVLPKETILHTAAPIETVIEEEEAKSDRLFHLMLAGGHC